MLNDAPEIAGFAIKSILGSGQTGVVYKAQRENHFYAIKIVKIQNENAKQEALLLFLKEAATIAKLSHPGLAKFHEVGEVEGRPYIVMELVEGESLQERIARRPLKESELILLIKSLSEILDYFHCRGIVHKDLKPENILFGARGEVKIIDFGFAEETNNIRQGANFGDRAAGTLLYAAPEQTGVLNRFIDNRTDLYALGGVLYHCATGRPAFDATTAIELLESHLTKKPVDPFRINPEIRPSLSAAIMKLLEKDPDDRYQSAKGLFADIENLSKIEQNGEPFRLGLQDSGLRVFEISLVGREQELNTIIAQRNKIFEGHGSALLIEGEGGSGKSRLVREFLDLPHDKKIFVMAGKAKKNESIPLGPLREAIDDILSRARRSSEIEQKRIFQGIISAAGDFAGIIRRLSPGLQIIFHDAKDIPPLDGNAEQERFYSKVAEFFVSIAKYLGPTVLLVDDIQWLDDGSIEILREIAKIIGSVPFMLAATSRDDPGSKENLTRFETAIKDAQITKIILKPLNVEAVGQLIAAHLGGKELEPDSVSSIAIKTNGNPFAVGEYIRALLDRGMLKPTKENWVFDRQHFHELSLPDDVIQLLTDRIFKLTPDSIQLLSLAAVMGYEFEIPLLLATAQNQSEMVDRAVIEGQQQALIERTDRGYRFVHDRVCEALIQAIPEDRLKIFHQNYAETLDRLHLDDPQHVFALARHYFLGFPERNQMRVYQTSLAAGRLSLENFSNEEAIELLEQALKYARAVSVKSSELSLIFELLGLAFTRSGRHQEAIEHFSKALENLTSPLDCARLHYLWGLAHASQGQHDFAKNELFLALQLLGRPFPKTKIGAIFSLIGYWIAAHFRIRTRIGFGTAVGENRKRRELASKISSTVNLIAYFANDQLLLVQSAVRELHSVQFLGVCTETAKAHIFYAIVAGTMGLERVTEKHGKISISIAQQVGNQETLAYCELYYAVAIEFAGDVVRGHQLSLAVAPKVFRYCTAWDKACLISQRTHPVVAGKVQEAYDWIEKMTPELLLAGDVALLHATYSSQFSSAWMLGKASEAARILQNIKALPAQSVAKAFIETYFYCNVIHASLMNEEFGPDLEQAIERLDKVGLDMYHSRHRFAVAGYVRLEQFRRAQDQNEKQKFLSLLKKYVKKAGFPNALTPIHLSHAYVLKASYLVACGKFWRAKYYLSKAEQMATVSDNPWALFLVSRERARIAAAQGHSTITEVEANRSLQLANRYGWVPLAKQISREFQIKLNLEPIRSQDFTESKYGYGRLMTAQRKSEALLQISLASTSTLDPHLQSRSILDELVKVLGAERAFLFEADPAQPGKLNMKAGRDSDKNDIRELKGYSSTVVHKVGTEKRALVVSGTDDGEVTGAQSVITHGLRSILAVPVLFREKFLGVIYLDSTLAKGIFTEDDLEIVNALANHIAIALETIRSANMEIEHISMKKDLELTQVVQTLMLPKTSVFRTEHIEMSAFYKAASQSGGDWWWFDSDPEKNSLMVFMGDVTGHGAGPAMISAAVAGSYQAFKSMRQPTQGIPEFFEILNNTIFNLTSEEYLISMSAFELNLDNGQVDFWSAGAPPMIILRSAGSCEHASPPGMWLGKSKIDIGFERFQLEPGDRIALFTDGLYEMDLRDNTKFSVKRLEKLFVKTLPEPVEPASKAVMGMISDITTDIQEDDISLILVDYRRTSK